MGYYDNGEVRFIRELYDADPGAKACMLRLQGEIAIDAETGRIEVHADVDVTSKTTPGKGDWLAALDKHFVFDVSGNGWYEGTIALPDATGSVGETITLGRGEDPDSYTSCVWHPGDGTRLDPGHADNAGETAADVYVFPGTYQVMQLCYEGAPVRGQDPFPARLREAP